MNKILSAAVYLFSFVLSLLFCHEAEVSYSTNRRFYNSEKRKLCFFISICIPCILAALRSDNVGVDTATTVSYFNEISIINNFKDIQIGSDFGEKEFGFALISFLISRLTTSPEVILFCLQLLVIVPVLFSAINLKERVSITISMAVYLFVFYNNSLNLMRQSISCAFILLGTSFFLKNQISYSKSNIVKTVLFYYIASLFHKSAYIGIGMILCLCFLQKMPGKKFFRTVVYSLIIILPMLLSSIAQMMVKLDMMNQSFQYYFDIFVYKNVEKDFFSDPFSLYSIVNIIMRLMLVIVACYFLDKNSNDDMLQILKSLVSSSLLMFVVVLLVMKTSYGQRLSLYLDFFLIILMSQYDKKITNEKTYLNIITIVAYWLIWVMIFGWSGSELYDLRGF